MNARWTAIGLAVLASVLTLAQDVFPGRDWYHGWQYATVLAIAIFFMATYAWSARTGRDGTAGRRIALALAGAIAVAIAGLLSGLIGPDTVTIVGAPGTVVPVPDVGVAAFFGTADPASIARGDAPVTLRRPGVEARSVGAWPLPLGMSVVFTEMRPAAYIVARDARDNHLTITQPNNPAFLSPVVLFRQSQTIRAKAFPMDTFAVPASHRIAHILYFGAADLAEFRHGAPGATGDGAVLAVSDDAGVSKGITIAQSGTDVSIAGMRLTVTLGRYPVLLVASGPQPAVTIAGVLLFLAGMAWAFAARVPASTPSNSQT